MRRFLILSAAILALGAGCGHASIWSQTRHGGVIALHGSELACGRSNYHVAINRALGAADPSAAP